MTEMHILNKNHLSFWLRRLKTTHELIAPMRDISGDIVLTELPRMHETALDGPALMPSPKEFLLPQMEQLFCYSDEGIENMESLTILKVNPLPQFGTPLEIVGFFGGKEEYLDALHEIENQLYR